MIIAWAVWLFGTSFEFGDCIRERKEYETYQALHEKPFFVVKAFARIHLNSACAIHVADVYQGAIVALSGVAVAIFTATLWYSTHRLWKAGERQLTIATKAANAALLQAQAAVNVDRPFVYVSDLQLTLIPTTPQADGLERPDVYTVAFVFTNYGRTPAFVTSIGYGFSVGIEAPPVPTYHLVDDLTIEIVIRPEKEFKFDQILFFLSVAPEQKKDFAEGKIFPWLWGKIEFRDFLGGTAETGFIAFRYPERRVGDRVLQPEAFRLRGPAGYTYQKYQQGSVPTEEPAQPRSRGSSG